MLASLVWSAVRVSALIGDQEGGVCFPDVTGIGGPSCFLSQL